MPELTHEHSRGVTSSGEISQDRTERIIRITGYRQPSLDLLSQDVRNTGPCKLELSFRDELFKFKYSDNFQLFFTLTKT